MDKLIKILPELRIDEATDKALKEIADKESRPLCNLRRLIYEKFIKEYFGREKG